ncbi:MAG: MBL fold metallo-hydrolase [Fimbriimonadaceae bacterium]|nr:MBL fold metallo-hydrolase [Fimbriimonadaceae bacterium]QYK56890.1 MAG: MBL fold metallo-hydrolase [Fimbriimonadaceae bacterium]
MGGRGEVIVLGSGTSNGVPSLGKHYPPHFLANPKNHRTRPSIVICGPTGNVLVDCAPELRLQMLREQIYDLEAVMITHTHADHVMGMDDLRSLCLKYGRAIDIYTAPQYQEDIRRLFPYAFEDFPPGIFVPRFELHDVPDVVSLGGLEIETLWVEHGPLPVLALRVGNFAYVTDVGHIPPQAWKRLLGLDDLILDAVRYKPHPNHFHFEKAVEVAQELGAKRTYFTHLSDDYDHDEVELGLPASIRLAYDGLRLML